MSIYKLEVINLNNNESSLNLNFNEELNILTGRNGSGKTTVLKLLWFCISGNLERALREIKFDKLRLYTSTFVLFVEFLKNKSEQEVDITLFSPEGEKLLSGIGTLEDGELIDRFNLLVIELCDTSIFFPTFRRIEGGFSLGEGERRRFIHQKDGRVYRTGGYSDVQEALEKHSNLLSVVNHRFVTSISTVDIRELVERKHSEATNKVDEMSKNLTYEISSKIRDIDQSYDDSTKLKEALLTLDAIKNDLDGFEDLRKKAFKSLTVLSDLIRTIFTNKGIRLANGLDFGGQGKELIDSDALSAGEKQMLSFVCYNALYNDCPFFIDEPELSLHVDWQRMLLDYLVNQNTRNQFFIATHSPFIYSQYEDFEVQLNIDRGV